MLLASLGIEKPGIISFVGGGGKTSAIRCLSQELADVGEKCLVTTTTQMGEEEFRCYERRFLTLTWSEWEKNLGQLLLLPGRSILAVGRALQRGKLKGIPPEWIDKVNLLAPDWYILVEADGAARKPLKAPAAHEPVIPQRSQMVVGVVGAAAPGLPLTENNFHRWEHLAGLTGLSPGAVLGPEAVAKVILHPQGYQKNVPGRAVFRLLINGLFTSKDRESARKLALLTIKMGVERVVLANVQEAFPVKEVFCSDSRFDPGGGTVEKNGVPETTASPG
ncbi:MAG: selenium cofactor biosynthesis protein YqeC [Bacillota bacterium]